MKKILLTILSSIICILLATLGLFICVKYKLEHPFLFGAISGALSYIIALIFYDTMKNRTFKNPFKRLAFWVRYKKFRSCNGCRYFNNYKCQHLLFTYDKDFKYCRVKRSFSPLKWLKKLFFICIIALLFSSCSVYVNCNFNKVPKYKTTQQDSTVLQINEYWF